MIVTYTEINALEEFMNKYGVVIDIDTREAYDFDFVKASVVIDSLNLDVLIEDEYDDLLLNDPRVDLVLVLRELELIDHSSDYLHWCRLQGLLCSTERGKLHSYYQNIVWILPKLYQIFGKNEIETFVSDLDFELNTGAMLHLREPK